MTPPAVKTISIWWRSVWFGMKTDDSPTPICERWFGKNKTWRGLLSGSMVAMFVSLAQFSIRNDVPYLKPFTVLEYSPKTAALIGLLLGLGALLGDIAKSSIKRLLNKSAGTRWWPYDQLDYIFGSYAALGAAVVLMYVQFPPLGESLLTLTVLLVFSASFGPSANKLFHRYGLKEVPY